MESRIILSKADFSANNIGRYASLSDLTKKVLTKQTQYDLESNEAVALNTFLANLTEDGFIGGTNPLLKNLLIPALAANHSEFLYDILTVDGEGYPTDVMNLTEKAASVDNQLILSYKDDSNRILGMCSKQGDYSSGDAFVIPTSLFSVLNVAYPAHSIICYVPRNLAGNVSVEMIVNRAANYQVVTTNSGVRLSWINAPSNATIGLSISPRFTKGFYGMNYDGNKNFNLLLDTGTAASETTITGEQTNVLVTQADSYKFNLMGKGNYVSQCTSLSFIAFGEQLTTQQMTSLKGYVDELMTALHVKTE